MPAGRPDLFLDEIKIIQQPLRRRRIASLPFSSFAHEVIRLDKNGLVLIQSGNELAGRPTGGDLVGCRQRLGVPLELLNVEQLRPQW